MMSMPEGRAVTVVQGGCKFGQVRYNDKSYRACSKYATFAVSIGQGTISIVASSQWRALWLADGKHSATSSSAQGRVCLLTKTLRCKAIRHPKLFSLFASGSVKDRLDEVMQS